MGDTPLIRTWLDLVREARGWSFGQLGDLLGVSAPAAWRYCTAPHHPDHRRPKRAVGQALPQVTEGLVDLSNYSDMYRRIMPADTPGNSPERAPCERSDTASLET